MVEGWKLVLPVYFMEIELEWCAQCDFLRLALKANILLYGTNTKTTARQLPKLFKSVISNTLYTYYQSTRWITTSFYPITDVKMEICH